MTWNEKYEMLSEMIKPETRATTDAELAVKGMASDIDEETIKNCYEKYKNQELTEVIDIIAYLYNV